MSPFHHMCSDLSSFECWWPDDVPGDASGKEPPCQCRRCKRLRFQFLGWEDPWRRARRFTPVFLPGESRGQRSLAGCSPLGCRELEMAEQLSSTHTWPVLSVWLASNTSYSRVWSSVLFWIVYIIIAFVHSLSWSFSHSANTIVCLTYSRHCGRCWRYREQKDMVSMKGRSRFHRDQNLHLEGPLFFFFY